MELKKSFEIYSDFCISTEFASRQLYECFSKKIRNRYTEYHYEGVPICFTLAAGDQDGDELRITHAEKILECHNRHVQVHNDIQSRSIQQSSDIQRPYNNFIYLHVLVLNSLSTKTSLPSLSFT
jgi:hypothetical protein